LFLLFPLFSSLLFVGCFSLLSRRVDRERARVSAAKASAVGFSGCIISDNSERAGLRPTRTVSSAEACSGALIAWRLDRSEGR
jgi:hypothetical protein